MKYKCFCATNFWDLTIDEIKSMRRAEGSLRLPINDFIDYYDISAEDYHFRISAMKGISVISEERKALSDERKRNEPEEKVIQTPMDYMDINNMPDELIAALECVDFEKIKGKVYYNQDEMDRARERIESKLKRHEQVKKKTKYDNAYSELKGIDLIAARIYRGVNRKTFCKESSMKISDVKLFETSRQRVPQYIVNTYKRILGVKMTHFYQLREIMEGKTDKVVEDREIPKLVKLKVYKRDKGRCTKCGTNERTLHFHHIKRFSKGGNHEVKNIKMLCVNCHAEEHEGEKGYHLLLSQIKEG